LSYNGSKYSIKSVAIASLTVCFWQDGISCKLYLAKDFSFPDDTWCATCTVELQTAGAQLLKLIGYRYGIVLANLDAGQIRHKTWVHDLNLVLPLGQGQSL
jgi:hypothetical protein